MKRFFVLILEGSIFGAVIGFFVALITQNILVSIAVCVVLGAILRVGIDYAWKMYNQITGKALD